MKTPVDYGPIDALGTAKFFAQADKFKEAKVALDLVKPYCHHPAQIDAIGKIYADIREFNDCLEMAMKLKEMVTTPEGEFDVTSNIIRAYLNLNKPLEALSHIEINEKRRPNDHPTMMDKAMALFLLNRKTEAEAILRLILTQPRTTDIDNRVRFNLGTYDLSKGNFQEGLRGFLLEGRKLDIWKKYPLPVDRMWNGTIQKGRVVLLMAEGGIGDEIINIRFAKHIQKLGMTAVWYTDRKDLAQVFRRNGFDVIWDLSRIDPTWLWCYSMTAPCLLKVTEDKLWDGPYLRSSWRGSQMPGKLKIGFKCMGNPKYDQDLHRSIPYEQVLDVFPNDAYIYSFHIDEEIKHPNLLTLKEHINTWDDTLDFLDSMDLLVTSCTGLAHAASAMGKETVVMVPILNYYVWAKPGKHSPWYSEKTTILRQKEYDNWNAPIEELHEYFSARQER